jgi:hypothetical protein
MTVEITRGSAGQDHNANVGITSEFLQLLREHVTHFGIEIHALWASQGDNSNPFGDFCRQYIRVHRHLLAV